MEHHLFQGRGVTLDGMRGHHCLVVLGLGGRGLGKGLQRGLRSVWWLGLGWRRTLFISIGLEQVVRTGGGGGSFGTMIPLW